MRQGYESRLRCVRGRTLTDFAGRLGGSEGACLVAARDIKYGTERQNRDRSDSIWSSLVRQVNHLGPAQAEDRLAARLDLRLGLQ